jgi:rSAM/selenodomain-associated transferase 2
MRLAIVIPVLDDEQALETSLPAALAAADDVIVVDGGSQDRSIAVARESGAHTVSAPRGRGPQLAQGAQAALDRGAEVLLFLHADSLLPEDARPRIVESVSAGAVGGGFHVRFDDPSGLFRLGARIVNLRTRLLRMPLGDQGQFASAAAFEAAGGFPDWPILEDLDFVRRLRRQGRLSIVRSAISTSARRFRERGILSTVATNWTIWLLFALRVPPRRLARLYPPRASADADQSRAGIAK